MTAAIKAAILNGANHTLPRHPSKRIALRMHEINALRAIAARTGLVR